MSADYPPLRCRDRTTSNASIEPGDVLVDNTDEPPSLLALARQVGPNDFKLKAGFRQVFGTTVFGYLHEQRMERARQLLAERRFNVTEVACAVGYANPSHFAAAFKRKFGVNPWAYSGEYLNLSRTEGGDPS